LSHLVKTTDADFGIYFSGSLYFLVDGFDAYFKDPTLNLIAGELQEHYANGEILEYQRERSLEMSAFLAGNSNAVGYKKPETVIADGEERDGQVLKKSPRLELYTIMQQQHTSWLVVGLSGKSLLRRL
jgi:hypothetical protein